MAAITIPSISLSSGVIENDTKYQFVPFDLTKSLLFQTKRLYAHNFLSIQLDFFNQFALESKLMRHVKTENVDFNKWQFVSLFQG